MNRKTFLKTSVKLISGGLLLGGYAWQIEPFWLEFVKRSMPVKNLPSEFNGKTLMQISDLHIGNAFSREYIRDSLRKAQLLKPDIVVYTGDFITYESPEQFQQLDDVFSDLVLGKMATLAYSATTTMATAGINPK